VSGRAPEARRAAPAALRRRWEVLAAQEGLDPRREPWCWDAEGRLLVRPGRGLAVARRLAAEAAGALRLLPLKAEAPWRLSASRSALRRSPAHAAEQISELRLGDPFTVWHWDAQRTWCLGAGEDGYPGWLRGWHLLPGAGPRPRRVVVARWSRALAAPGARATVLLDLSFGTRLAPAGPARDGYVPWRLPDRRRAWTPAADLAPWPGPRGGAAARAELLRRGLGLLGLPYVWGGASSGGLDCSGLVQLLCGAQGRQLPRDADLQAACGRPRDPGAPASWLPGDLLFFGEPRLDHVGILAPEGRLLHASGEVGLETLGEGGSLRGRPLQAVRSPLEARWR
jgi:hypothetical protein